LHGADVAVNLHGRGPESTALLAVTRPRRLIAFGETVAWRDDEHERVRWCRLLTAAGIPADPDDFRVPPPRVAAPPVAVGATVLDPGASSPARRWPADRWAALATGRHVVVTGDASEVDLAHEVAHAAGIPAGHVLAGRSDLLAL